MEQNEIDFEVWEAEKANGTKSTSRWFQTNLLSRAAVCNSLHEIETNVNMLVLLKRKT
jgi:hypothetical protein